MRHRDALAALSLYLVALSVRLIPLILSPLPYNIDGFAQVRLAQGIATTGWWSLQQDPANAYNLKMPILPVFLAAASGVLGIDPLTFVQVLIALVASAAIPTTYALVRKLGGSSGASAAAGAFLALSGTFVFLTSSTMKEAIGLALLPLTLLMWQGAEDPRRKGLAVALLALLPFLHNLTTAMALAFVAAMALEKHFAAYRSRELKTRAAIADVSLLGVLAAVPLLYYSVVRMEFFSELANGQDLPLLLSVAFIFSLVALALASKSPARPLLPMGARGLINGKGLTIVGMLILVVANQRRSVFTGTATTTPTLFMVALAYLPLALLALIGFELARASGPRLRTWVVALILVPLGVMVFALLRGLDPLSFIVLYRSFDFLDFGIALCIGTAATSSIIKGASRKRAIGAVLVASLLLTLPAAFATPETFGVRNATSPAEFAALGHFAAVPPIAKNTDQRYRDILAMYWSQSSQGTLPLELQSGGAPNGSYLLVAEDWASFGAQVYPLPRVKIPGPDFASLVRETDVIYANSQGLLILMNQVS